MRYIVIGGSGFVGQYVIHDLSLFIQNTDKIVCLDKIKPHVLPQYTEFIEFDITKDDFAFCESDIVIHLAARSYAPKPPKKDLQNYFFEVNVNGTKRLIDSMLLAQCYNLIYFSTDMVYGKPLYLPVDSNHARNPFGYYGLSKTMAEDYIIHARERGLQATIFRPRIIVGAGRYGILTKLFWLMDKSMPIPLIGNGRNCYQMISVRDCASAIICALKHNIPNDIFNLGSLNPPTIKDLLQFVITQSHSKSILLPTWGFGIKKILWCLESLGMPLMYKEQYMIADEEYIVDITKTMEVLQWNPKDNDRDMLLNAYKEYKERYKN